MKRYTENHSTTRCQLLFLVLAACLALPLPSLAASVALATSPLATSTTSTVKPNVLLVLDDSGSMDWDHMPDDSSDAGSAVTFSFGYYGLRSNQCNQVYYDPSITYLPPLHPDGTSYPDASFTGAWTNGFSTGAGTVNLNTSFKASLSLNADSTGQSAYYYLYSGAQTTTLLKNYNSTTNTFYSECHSANNATPGSTVFSKRRLAATETATIVVGGTGGSSSPYASVSGITVNGAQIMNAASATASSISSSTMASNIAAKITLNGFSATASGSTVTITGPASAADYTPVISTSGGMGSITLTADVFPDTTAAKLTNFANWYSYYRYRMLMMKTATGRAFSSLNKNYRVGLMQISSSNTPTVYVDTFWDNSDTSLGPVSTQRTTWYTTLYGITASGSTPLRTALSDAGRYYAGKLSGADPLQYSCQQNFTILSTDGYWNTGDGYKLDGSTAVGNQDGLLSRPFYDGAATSLARSTSQIQKTQTQVRQSTSQLQKRTQQIQSSTSSLQISTSKLQSQAWQLQSSTKATSGGSFSTPTNVATCTYHDANPYPRTKCSYVAGALTNVSSCTDVAKTTSTSDGTVWNPNAVTCNTVTTGPTNTSNCTAAVASSSNNWIATTCAYTAYSTPVSASSCTTVLPSGGSPYTVGTATQCQTTDSGWGPPDPQLQTRTSSNSGATWTSWSDAASCTADSSGTNRRECQTITTCTPSSSGGQTVTCQTNTTGPTLVDSCTAAIASSANGYTTTTCDPTTILSATPVASCTAGTDPITHTTTTCNTVTTGPTIGTCTAAAASSSNNWTTTTCTPTITGGGTSDTLADVAMYYYQTDLRTPALLNCGTPAATGPLCENNVFLAGTDRNLQQHMTTFTLGLGASGWMNYSSSYLNDTGGDYAAVKNGSTANSAATPPVCSWQANGTACGWPIPGITSGNGWIANIDDLWHAAVNGHGAYFSATNPTSLSAGLSNALAGINARKGSAAAAATSTLNPVAGNNFAYVASYTTVTWKGNLEARGINVNTGQVNENATWCVENVPVGNCPSPGAVVADTSGATTAYSCVTPNSVICAGGTMSGTDCVVPVATACTGTMGAKVSDTSDTRTIKTANSTGTALVDFVYANLGSTNFAAAHINTLSQWPLLTTAQQTAAAGVNLVNFLRGQYGYEDRSGNADANKLYRYREAVLGDALESQPSFIGKPIFSYPYPGYSEPVTGFKAAQAGRAGTVYMGANDGMMHAFNASNGNERWAYVPSMVIPNMWMLADKNYPTLHRNFVNGSPITSDVCTANCTVSATAVWKTVLVAGLNGGGRGYYALDITVPDTPVLLWEFTPAADSALGYSFGQPVITRKNDGTWVVLVTSGYDNGTLSSDPTVNNSPAGDGKGYLYVLNAATGAIISKITTNVGTAATPSGLAKIAGWNNETGGNTVSYVYGGDLQGNVWRFDINSTSAATIGTGAVMKLAALYSDAAGTSPQPITTTPVLGKISGKRVVFIGTGKYLETGDLTTTQIQTQYAIKDDDATSTLFNPRTTLVNQTLGTNPDGTASRVVTSSNTVNFYTGRGWYVDFPDSGERVNIDSKLVEGTLLVPTIVPSNTVCTPGGYGWLNFFDYKTGGAVETATSLGSVKYDATIVGVNVIYIGGQPKVGVVTSTNPTPELNPNVGFAATAAGFSGKRVIWRELIP